MERKLKIMGIYISLLFFVSILLILITSLSNSKMDPTYEVTEVNRQQAGFNTTMQDSVFKLTETNHKLNEKVKEQTGKIEGLEKSLNEKDSVINDYKVKYNEDTENLIKALDLYVSDNEEESKTILETVNKENLSVENQLTYDNLLNKLK